MKTAAGDSLAAALNTSFGWMNGSDWTYSKISPDWIPSSRP